MSNCFYLFLNIVQNRKNQSNVIEEVTLPKNSFNNDGSFFENFKKITDAAKIAQKELEEKLAPPIVTTLSQANEEAGIEGKDENPPEAADDNPQQIEEHFPNANPEFS